MVRAKGLKCASALNDESVSGLGGLGKAPNNPSVCILPPLGLLITDVDLMEVTYIVMQSFSIQQIRQRIHWKDASCWKPKDGVVGVGM